MDLSFLGVIYGENFEDEISYALFSRKKIFREFRLVIDV